VQNVDSLQPVLCSHAKQETLSRAEPALASSLRSSASNSVPVIGREGFAIRADAVKTRANRDAVFLAGPRLVRQCGTPMSLRIRLVAALAVTLVPAIASASPRVAAKLHKKHPRVARASRACLKAPVEFVSTESATFALAKCDGTALPAAIDRLSQLVGAPSGHHLDTRLVAQLEAVVDHFRGHEVPRVVVLSAYRPPSAGTYHSTGRALDFRIDGVENEALFAFCKTLPDMGCGSYPNGSFVHIDVRELGTGHVAWTDVGNPGEAPTAAPSEAPKGSALPPLPATP
jgi:uncharacterized protein YcbK (DUF882 family)